MNIKKKLVLGLLAVLMPVPALTVFSKDDDFFSEPEFDNEPLPAYFNLFDEGRMTTAKSQGRTGLCWMFFRRTKAQ